MGILVSINVQCNECSPSDYSNSRIGIQVFNAVLDINTEDLRYKSFLTFLFDAVQDTSAQIGVL